MIYREEFYLLNGQRKGTDVFMKKTTKRVLAVMFCALLLFGSISAQAKEEVKPSTAEYEVHISSANHVFIGNKKPVDWKVGNKYFLVYTVEEVTQDTSKQGGAVITTDPTVTYPHTKGGMNHANKEGLMLKEGYTYFLRFEVLENGVHTLVARAKGSENEYLRLTVPAGDLTTKGPYFGAWISEGLMTAKLTKVRCYDDKGNDLGVYGNENQRVTVIDTSVMTPNTSIKHSYSFSLKEAGRIAFGSLRPTDSKVVYLEYTIKNIKAKDVIVNGAILTNQPTAVYPYETDGKMNFWMHRGDYDGESQFLDEGAKYIYRFERDDESDTMNILIRRTVNGKHTYITLPHYAGTYKDGFRYVAAWYGEYCSLTADFVDVKCYDAKGNNLAIQTNQGVKVTHYGPLEDYSKCEAVYYCKETNTFITLDDECNASKLVAGEGKALMGTYQVQEAVMTLTIGKDVEKFDYRYASFVDVDGNVYMRMKENTVTFHSRSVGGEVIESIQATAENGYKVTEPEAPKTKGLTFVGWRTGDGKEFDFNQVIVNNVDLYAEWDGEGEYTLTSILENITKEVSLPVVIGVSIGLVGLTGVGIALMYRRKKNGTEA